MRAYVGAGAFDRIAFTIQSLVNDPRSGAEKRQYVLDFAVSEFSTISKSVVRAVIEIYLIAKAPAAAKV
jgi:hypothetical protein